MGVGQSAFGDAGLNSGYILATSWPQPRDNRATTQPHPRHTLSRSAQHPGHLLAITRPHLGVGNPGSGEDLEVMCPCFKSALCKAAFTSHTALLNRIAASRRRSTPALMGRSHRSQPSLPGETVPGIRESEHGVAALRALCRTQVPLPSVRIAIARKWRSSISQSLVGVPRLGVEL
jgi:hypothetical protein